jgi:two-component system, sensor histidine kinase LadS
VFTPTKLSFAFILLFGTVQAWCQPFRIGVDQNPLGVYSEFYVDESASLKLEGVLDESRVKFTKSQESTLNFGPTASACWVRFSYTSTDTLRHYLGINNTNLHEVSVYILRGKSIISRQEGGLSRKTSQSSSDLNLNAWLFELPRADAFPNTVYVRVTDKRRVILPLEITTLNEVIDSSHQEDFLFGLFFGCLDIIAVLNIYFLFYFRERIYLFYGGHIFCQILINGILQGYVMSLFGTSWFFLSPYVPAIAGISNVFTILFAISFLNVKETLPKWYKPTLLLLTLPVTNIVLNVFGFYTASASIGSYVGIAVSVWLFALALAGFSNQIMQARFYVIGWGAFFIGILILNSALNGWIPVNEFTFNAAMYGTLFEVLLISFALADRINVIRKSHEQERQQRLSLIEQQKSWLEENVKLRTIELVQKNKEIEVQNEELRQQHEELTTTHELLERQKELVEERNRDIGLINQTLEEKVRQRTLELEETVRNLVNQNNDLEQFSYIVSHNMRAPVARILGLINLLTIDDEPEERAQLIEYLKEATVGLDEIIHDLSQIIDLRRGSEMILERIDLEKIVQHNLSDLTEELKKAKAQVNLSIQAKETVAVKGYMQSILYNLISNAIKYRDTERQLVLNISTRETRDSVVVEVQDNGLGVSLPAERLHEIFHLYKRAHTHVQGKGLGLYLVKTQVEALGGEIEVKSASGEGSTFRVSLPKVS